MMTGGMSVALVYALIYFWTEHHQWKHRCSRQVKLFPDFDRSGMGGGGGGRKEKRFARNACASSASHPTKTAQAIK